MKTIDPEDKIRRDDAVDAFAEAIKRRLDDKAAQGYAGWDGEYPSEDLAFELAADTVEFVVGQGTAQGAIDIAARAMMLWFRHTKGKEAAP